MTQDLAPYPGESVFETASRTFHRMTGSPVASGRPSLEPDTISPGRLLARTSFLIEEVIEGVDAAHGTQAGDIMREAWARAQEVARTCVHTPDVVKFADSLADSVYIIAGTANETAIPLGAVFAEVHRSNMTKRRADGTVLKRPDGKVIKPAEYEPPNIAAVLGAYVAPPALDARTVREAWNRAVDSMLHDADRGAVVSEFARLLGIESHADPLEVHEVGGAAARQGRDPLVAMARALGAYVEDGAKTAIIVEQEATP